jgi:hypothetical protein
MPNRLTHLRRQGKPYKITPKVHFKLWGLFYASRQKTATGTCPYTCAIRQEHKVEKSSRKTKKLKQGKE